MTSRILQPWAQCVLPHQCTIPLAPGCIGPPVQTAEVSALEVRRYRLKKEKLVVGFLRKPAREGCKVRVIAFCLLHFFYAWCTSGP